LGKRHGNNQHGKKEDSLTLDTPQGRSDELAAEAVGWGKDTYRKAKAVVDSGNEDAKAAMDSPHTRKVAPYYPRNHSDFKHSALTCWSIAAILVLQQYGNHLMTKTHTVKMDERLSAMLEDEAKRQRMATGEKITKSDVIRQALERYLAKR